MHVFIMKYSHHNTNYSSSCYCTPLMPLRALLQDSSFGHLAGSNAHPPLTKEEKDDISFLHNWN